MTGSGIDRARGNYPYPSTTAHILEFRLGGWVYIVLARRARYESDKPYVRTDSFLMMYHRIYLHRSVNGLQHIRVKYNNSSDLKVIRQPHRSKFDYRSC